MIHSKSGNCKQTSIKDRNHIHVVDKRKSFDFNKQNNMKNKQTLSSSIRPSASHSNSLDLIAQFKKQHYSNDSKKQFSQNNDDDNLNILQNSEKNSISNAADNSKYKQMPQQMSHSSSFSHATRHSSLQVNHEHQQPNQLHGHSSGGFLLGTFLKVWTRLKRPILPHVGAKSSSTGSTNKLTQLNSQNGFEYIPGEQLRVKSVAKLQTTTPTKLLNESKMLKLCDEDFRQNHYKQQQHQQYLLSMSDQETNDVINNNRIICQNSNTGSSGISSSSSQQLTPQQLNYNTFVDLTQSGQGHSACSTPNQTSSPSMQSPLQTCNILSKHQDADKKNLNVNHMATTKKVGRRISAPSQLTLNNQDNGQNMIRLHNNNSGNGNLNGSVHNGKLSARQRGHLRSTLSEDVAEQMSDSLSGDDIYSTPNDSVVSLQGNNRSMVKSHSTNNFSTISMSTINTNFKTRDQNLPRLPPLPPPLPPRVSLNDNVNNDKKLSRTNQNSRFFVSSSSSEDSSAISNQEQALSSSSTNNNQQINDKNQAGLTNKSDFKHQKLPFRLGVHYHSISPPSSLIKTSMQSIVMTSQQQQLHQHSNLINLSYQQQQQQQYPKNSLFLPIEEHQQVIVNQTAPMSPMDISSPTRKVTSFMKTRTRQQQLMTSFYKKSPSLHDFQNVNKLCNNNQIKHQNNNNENCSQYKGNLLTNSNDDADDDEILLRENSKNRDSLQNCRNKIPNSVSLYNCRAFEMPKQCVDDTNDSMSLQNCNDDQAYCLNKQEAEFKLAQMLLNLSSNLNVKDDDGHTALMYATLSDNFASVKCLVENGANINETNNLGLTAMDLLCGKEPTEARLKMVS